MPNPFIFSTAACSTSRLPWTKQRCCPARFHHEFSTSEPAHCVRNVLKPSTKVSRIVSSNGKADWYRRSTPKSSGKQIHNKLGDEAYWVEVGAHWLWTQAWVHITILALSYSTSISQPQRKQYCNLDLVLLAFDGMISVCEICGTLWQLAWLWWHNAQLSSILISRIHSSPSEEPPSPV